MSKEIMKEIEGNWNYERCIKPEHVDYLIEQNKRYREELESLLKHAEELADKDILMSPTAVEKSIEKSIGGGQMKTYLTNEQRMTAYYQDQLSKLGFTDTEQLSYAELKYKLTVEKTKNINYEHESNQFF